MASLSVEGDGGQEADNGLHEPEPQRRCSAATGKPRRHSVLMDTSVKNFQRLLNSAGEFMRDEIENLPLRKYEWVLPKPASRPLPFVCCPQKCSSLKKELTARPSENDCGKACWWHVEDILYFSVNGFIPRKLAPCCSGSRTKAGRGLTWRKRTSCSSSTSWPASSSSMRWASYCSSRRRGKREFFIKAAQKKKEIFLAVFIQVSNYPL